MLIEHGDRVVATARNRAQVEDLAMGHDGQALALQLDADDAEIAEAVKEAETAFGQIDVLVDDAGYGYLSAVEEGEERNARDFRNEISLGWRS